jgi:hypothetical protein
MPDHEELSSFLAEVAVLLGDLSRAPELSEDLATKCDWLRYECRQRAELAAQRDLARDISPGRNSQE